MSQSDEQQYVMWQNYNTTIKYISSAPKKFCWNWKSTYT